MKTKRKFLSTVLCAMLFTLSFSTVTAYATSFPVLLPQYYGTYQNDNNLNSHITLRNDPNYSIVAIIVPDNTLRHVWFNGSTDLGGIDAVRDEFIASFDKARKVDENGTILGGDNYWLNGVEVFGTVSSKTVWFKTKYVITISDDELPDAVYTME